MKEYLDLNLIMQKNNPLNQIILSHSKDVKDFSLKLFEENLTNKYLNKEFLETGAFYHDFGIFKTEKYFFNSTEKFRRHKTLGSEILSDKIESEVLSDFENKLLLASSIIARKHGSFNLTQDYVNKTFEFYGLINPFEFINYQLIIFSDLFFSKKNLGQIKPVEKARNKLKFEHEKDTFDFLFNILNVEEIIKKYYDNPTENLAKLVFNNYTSSEIPYNRTFSPLYPHFEPHTNIYNPNFLNDNNFI